MDQIDVIIADLDAHAERVCVDLTLEITARLQIATPIDLGWARAGWVPSIGAPYTGGANLKPDPILVRIAAAEQAEAVGNIPSYKITQGPIWISNNVVYIQRLNDGWSKQAPSGFVQAEVAQAIDTVKARQQ